MNIIFLTMSRIFTISNRGVNADLMRKFRDEGHQVYIVSPRERSLNIKPGLENVEGVHFLGVKTLNLQKTNVIEKGLGQLLVETQYKKAIRRFLDDIDFDLILYSTPPITFPKVIKYLRTRNPHAKTYLLLKDIFPQNAVDIGMMSKTGLKGLLYRYFRDKEKKLYALSDYIGCMSPANVEYILSYNQEINRSRVEVAPNSIELAEELDADEERAKRSIERSYIRSKYNLPLNKPIFIYGGNLGKPQGIDYLVKCLDANKHRDDCLFIVVGNGTEYKKISSWLEDIKSKKEGVCIRLMPRLPKKDYDMLVRSCDVGLIFLDHRFTIPNFPSRLLPYLEYKIPIIAATDINSDTGSIAEKNGYGYWCESVKPEDFTTLVDKMLLSDRKAMGDRGYEYLKKNYLVSNTYEVIMKHLDEETQS